MKESFDIRIEKDRISLSEFLPEFDGRIFHYTRDNFLAGLATAASYLGNMDWMVYQWGCFVVPTGGKTKLILRLDQLITLGLQLQRLSCFENFENLIAGFRNQPQFQDARFEVEVANFFAQLDWVKMIRFAPEQKVRGRVKQPDFQITGCHGTFYVECKRCHLHLQKTHIALNNISNRFREVMDAHKWPNSLRLEVEIVGPLAGNINAFINTTVQIAIGAGTTSPPITAGPFCSHIVRRSDTFRLPSANWLVDTMVIGDVATGILNPEYTMLRVANYLAYERCQRSVGARTREALRQLPEGEHCMIFIGDLPVQVGYAVFEKRLNDPIYDHVITFGIWEIEAPGPTLLHRDKDGAHVGLLFGRGG